MIFLPRQLVRTQCNCCLPVEAQVSFFTWGCVVTQPVMNLLHVAFSQPPILMSKQAVKQPEDRSLTMQNDHCMGHYHSSFINNYKQACICRGDTLSTFSCPSLKNLSTLWRRRRKLIPVQCSSISNHCVECTLQLYFPSI